MSSLSGLVFNIGAASLVTWELSSYLARMTVLVRGRHSR